MIYDYEIMHAAIKILDRRAKHMDDELYHRDGVRGRNDDRNNPQRMGPAIDGRLQKEIANYARQCVEQELDRANLGKIYNEVIGKHRSGGWSNPNWGWNVETTIRKYSDDIGKRVADKVEKKYGYFTGNDYNNSVINYRDEEVLNAYEYAYDELHRRLHNMYENS